MSTSRRDFIGGLAATGMLAALPVSFPLPVPLRASERAAAGRPVDDK